MKFFELGELKEGDRIQVRNVASSITEAAIIEIINKGATYYDKYKVCQTYGNTTIAETKSLIIGWLLDKNFDGWERVEPKEQWYLHRYGQKDPVDDLYFEHKVIARKVWDEIKKYFGNNSAKEINTNQPIDKPEWINE